MKNIKLLLISDLHSKRNVLKSINHYLASHKFDAVVCTGDIISTPDPLKDRFLDEFVSMITRLHNLPLFAVPGNNETEANTKFLYDKKVSIHNQVKKFKGYVFFGIGGWGDEAAREAFAKLPFEKTIFVTHIPPHRISAADKDKIGNGPFLHLCGHLHGNGAIWKIGETLVVKIPTAEFGKTAILELPSKKINFIDL